MAFLLHSTQHASEGDVVDVATHVVDVLLALFLAVLVAWPQGLVPPQSGMATAILGLSIEVVGSRSVQPPAGHTYASQTRKLRTRTSGVLTTLA